MHDPAGHDDQRQDDDEAAHLTDRGNALRFAQDHGQDAHYVHDWKKWLFWDGKRWAIDRTGEAERRAKRTVKKLFDEAIVDFNKAAKALKEADENDEALVAKLNAELAAAKKLVAFALQSEHVSRIEAMLKLARSEPGIPCLPTDLDKNPRLFNCKNGTLDLKTGVLRQHDRADLITKICPTRFVPEAQCPMWTRAVATMYDNDPEMIAFDQRLSGYFLTGTVDEDLVAICYGTGSNGKTVNFETKREVIGKDYADAAAPDLLLTKKGERHATEIADLHGKRLVICQETDDGRDLNEALLKRLSGKDELKGRRMKEDFWSFTPTHKIVMCTNHKPVVKGQDHAIWRRLALIPFDVRFWRADRGETGPEEHQAISDLKDKLKAEREGILAWIVAGCLSWQRSGMMLPAKVMAATEDYREGEDKLGTFIRECCVTGPNYRVRASHLFDAFTKWIERNNEGAAPSSRAFGQAMTAKRFERLTNNGVWYLGIALQHDHTEEENCAVF